MARGEGAVAAFAEQTALINNMKNDLNNLPSTEHAKIENSQVELLQILSFATIGILVLLVYIYFSFPFFGWHPKPETLGQFGDYIGGILNPVVAMFALLALVVGVGIQKTVLEETRKELKVTQEIATEQAKTADQQRREQRFFDLLNLYQRTVDSNRYSDSSSTFVGKSAIEIWLKNGSLHELRAFEYRGFYPGQAVPGSFDRGLNEADLVRVWNCPEKSNFLDHYFRMVYRILSEAETLLGDDHIRYIKLLRAQLNRSELTLLAYNMWLDKEGVDMRPLAEKYELLKHLHPGKLREEVSKVLSPKVFGNVKVLA